MGQRRRRPGRQSRPKRVHGHMPHFYFQIRSATRRATAGNPVRFSDYAAARDEAAGIFTDFARNIAIDLASDPVWQLEVLDGDGRPIFRIKVAAETQ
ncbi:MAG: hypothetical protein JWR89_3449 [Tardiphaga sp.]|nr:hypothetical protein [Tardiphaga sp.]